MKISFPDYAIKCLEKIESAKFEAWFVGGCVRDSLIERRYSDVDITTNALPEEIETLFEKTIPTGKKHGTITVIIDNNPIEVTTYRSEFGYDDNRHPNEIHFEKDISADLSRRDFTINALAFNPKHNILDLFGGQNDLKNKIIKTVGNPNNRFSEDALRILRAYRFASELGFEICNETRIAALSLSRTISNLSGERVLSELKRLSTGKNPYVIEELLATRCLLEFGVGKLKNIPETISDIDDKYKTPLFFFLCEYNTELIKDKLKSDNKLIRQLEILDLISKSDIPKNKTELKLLFSHYPDYIELYLNYVKLIHPEIYCKIKSDTDDILTNHEPYLTKDLAIGGKELLEIGMGGTKIGEILDKLTLWVIENPNNNKAEVLISRALEIK